MKKIIGLQIAMQQHGHKFKDVADILGISYQSVQAWCNGKNIPQKRLDELEKLYQVDGEVLKRIVNDKSLKNVLEGKNSVLAKNEVVSIERLSQDVNLVLQPTSDKVAKINFKKTLANSIQLNDIEGYLNPKEVNELRKIYPLGNCFIWGVKSGGNETTLKQYSKLKQNDLVIFYQDKKFYAFAEVQFLSKSKELAEFLWDDQIFENIYFVDSLKPFYLEVQQFNKIIYGKEEEFPVMGFKVLNEVQSETLLNELDMVVTRGNVTIQKEISKEQLMKRLLELESNKELESVTKKKNRMEQQLLRAILFVNKTSERCACCGEEVPIEFLVTAYIKRRSHCNKEEKLDSNIVIPMCKFGCDELYEAGLLVVNEEGKFIRTDKINGVFTTKKIDELLSEYDNKVCEYWNEKTKGYFEFHFNSHVKSF